jgi:hypothetical protein
MYYKPYSLWTRDCQKEYPTTEVAELGSLLASAYDAKVAVLILSIITMSLPYAFYLTFSWMFFTCDRAA